MLTKAEKLEQITPWVDAFWECKSINAEATERVVKNKQAIVLSVFDKVPMLPHANPRVPEPYTIQIMRRKAGALEIPFTEAAFSLLSLGLLQASPAVGVMYLCAIKHLNVTMDDAQINSAFLVDELLENRIIGPVELEQLWTLQKRPGYNLLDLMGPGDFIEK